MKSISKYNLKQRFKCFPNKFKFAQKAQYAEINDRFR